MSSFTYSYTHIYVNNKKANTNKACISTLDLNTKITLHFFFLHVLQENSNDPPTHPPSIQPIPTDILDNETFTPQKRTRSELSVVKYNQNFRATCSYQRSRPHQGPSPTAAAGAGPGYSVRPGRFLNYLIRANTSCPSAHSPTQPLSNLCQENSHLPKNDGKRVQRCGTHETTHRASCSCQRSQLYKMPSPTSTPPARLGYSAQLDPPCTPITQYTNYPTNHRETTNAHKRVTHSFLSL